MKKILGVSFAAMLAVSPMMASAADLPTITLLGDPAGTVATESNVATTSYVKGAYNDLAGKINTDRGAINANTGAIATLNGDAETEGSVDYKIAAASSSLSGNIANKQDKSDSEVTAAALSAAGLTAGTDLTVGQGVGANLVTVATKIKTLNGDSSTTGSVLKSIKDNASGADYDNTTSGLTATTIKTAIDELKSDIDTAATTVGNTYQAKTDSEVTAEALTQNGLTNGVDLVTGQSVGTNLVAVAKKAKANAGEITTLKGDVNTTGSVLKSIKDNAAGATYDNTTSGLTATTLTGAINEVEGRVDTLETTVSGLGTNGATKEGVVATINHSTVTVYTDWNSGGTPSGASTVSVQAGGTNHNEYYAAANATGVAQPEQ